MYFELISRRRFCVSLAATATTCLVPVSSADAQDAGCQIEEFLDVAISDLEELQESLYRSEIEQTMSNTTQDATIGVIVPVALVGLLIWALTGGAGRGVSNQIQDGTDQNNNSGRPRTQQLNCDSSGISCP